MTENKQIEIPRATGLLVIVVENSNPNGDPDQESDPRRRSHDNRGMISGVSFKRKVRDLILRKDGLVWQKLAENYHITKNDTAWSKDGYSFDILEDRELKGSEVNGLLDDAKKKDGYKEFKNRFWDGRVFGNTFLPEKTKGHHVRSGVAHFGLATSISPVRVHRLTKTKMAPPGGRKDDNENGQSRGMAPLAHRVVEHGVYVMPFFINPTGAQGELGTGCAPLDIALLLNLIRYAYPHTKSDIRPLVEVRHAWYAEHNDDLGSFSELDFIEKIAPTRKGGDFGKPSVSGVPLSQQYDIPSKSSLTDEDKKKFKDGKLYDLCVELPEWCNKLKGEGKNA
ncbi:MAG TPA: type I CRISPR-associated protein Cas7 [Syntrophomonas sp.]|nr:type I CRISPR-associated protein Cas7 [Syntrophomonas sp.]